MGKPRMIGMVKGIPQTKDRKKNPLKKGKKK